MSKSIINGIDVSECNIRFNHFEKNICELGNRKLGELHYLCSENPNCYFKQLKRLQKENEDLKTYIQKMDKPEIKTIDSEIALKNIELQQENEKIKKQYNCYACGNCNGKEDYIHLEIHHKGLRKQFDELVKRNYTLSLRIEELEKENEVLKNTPRLELDTSYIREKELECIKYKQALEEIRKVLEYYANSWANPLQYPDLHYNSKKAKDALLKVDEVLK